MSATGWIQVKILTTLLAVKRLAGVAPEVNLRNNISCMLLPSTNKVAHLGFETQGRHHQKYKTGVSVAPQKGLISSKNFKRRMHSSRMRTVHSSGHLGGGSCLPGGCLPYWGVGCLPSRGVSAQGGGV